MEGNPQIRVSWQRVLFTLEQNQFCQETNQCLSWNNLLTQNWKKRVYWHKIFQERLCIRHWETQRGPQHISGHTGYTPIQQCTQHAVCLHNWINNWTRQFGVKVIDMLFSNSLSTDHRTVQKHISKITVQQPPHSNIHNYEINNWRRVCTHA